MKNLHNLIIYLLLSIILYYLGQASSNSLFNILAIICFAIFLYFFLRKPIKRFFSELGYVKTNHPPRWVVRIASKAKWANLNQYLLVKGHHYKYRIFCVGQGQFEFYKKKRR